MVNQASSESIGTDLSAYAVFSVGLNNPSPLGVIMGRRKTQKIIRTGPKNVTTGMCPMCRTIGRILVIGQTGKEKGKCPACNQIFDL